jgi:KTSC domain
MASSLNQFYFEARSGLPETPDALDQRGVIGDAGAVVPDAVWRQAHDRALAALEMPGIVVVLGPVGASGTFLRELMAGLRERGRPVTFVPRPDLPRWWRAVTVLIIEDAAQMDAALLEGIFRPPGRRIVLAGLPASAVAELPALTPAALTVVTLEPLSPATAAALRSSMSKARAVIESGVLASALAKLPAPLTPAPLTVVTPEPLSPGTATAPRSSSRSNARVAIASGVLAATGVAGALLWTRAPWAPPAPAPSRLAALQPAVELPPAPGSPSAPPEPAPSASEQPGEATSAISPVPLPAGDEDRPGIVTSLELPAQTGPRSGSEPVRPQLQAGPSPGSESRQELNVPPAVATPPLAEAPRATPPEPAAPGRVTALQPTIELPPTSGSPSAPWAPPEKPSPKLVQAEAGIGCPPRDTFENAQAWVHERLKCERHPTPNGLWIEWAEYCPSGPLGYIVLKVKTGQQKVYLFENIPPTVWEGFKAAPSADKFYHSEIKGKRHWFRLASKLKSSAPELTCR